MLIQREQLCFPLNNLFVCDRMNVQLTTADKKFAIFDSTLQLIKDYGFHGAPISQIARQAGVATGTIYHYFDSKEELIIELFHHQREKILHVAFNGINAAESYPARFAAIWTSMVKYYMENPAALAFMEQFFSSPFLKIILTKEMICFQDEISMFLREGIETGYLKELDLNIISAVYLGTVATTAKRHNNGYFTYDEEDLRSVAGIIWDGIKK